MEKHRGELLLLLGIASFFVPFLGVAAWIYGRIDLDKIRKGKMDPEGRSMTNWGYQLGQVTTFAHITLLFLACFLMSTPGFWEFVQRFR